MRKCYWARQRLVDLRVGDVRSSAERIGGKSVYLSYCVDRTSRFRSERPKMKFCKSIRECWFLRLLKEKSEYQHLDFDALQNLLDG